MYVFIIKFLCSGGKLTLIYFLKTRDIFPKKKKKKICYYYKIILSTHDILHKSTKDDFCKQTFNQ